MTRITNLCPWPNATVSRAEWNTQAVQDKTTGLWTYTLKDGASQGTCPIFATSIQYGVKYVAMVESATPVKGAGIGFSDGGRVTDITVTDTQRIGWFTVEQTSGRFAQIYLWMTGDGATITPKHVGLYAMDDWTALQKLGLAWFDGSLMPLA